MAIFGYLAMFGGFLSFVRVLSNWCAKDFQTFSQENSMVKMLYSSKTLKWRNDDENDDPVKLIKDDLNSREIFSYKYNEHWLQNNFDSKYCCCCRRKNTENDELFLKARKKLHKELDTLKLIKAVRQGEYVTQLHLTQYQQMLVKFFDDYTLVRQPKEVDIDEALLTRESEPAELFRLNNT